MISLFVKTLFACSISFFITLYLIPHLISVAHKLGIVDNPDGAIKTHKSPTPYLGGVAIYAGFIATLALVYPFENHIFSLLVGSTLLLFVGLIDDLIAMSPYQKFVGQLFAALCFLKGGLFLKGDFFSNTWYLALPLSLMWTLTMINAINLIDVMDGLSTTVALGATIGFMVLAYALHDQNLVLLLASFTGPLAAFLWFNKPPAAMYMGDAGALLIGGFLASIPFLFTWSCHAVHGYLVPIVILAIPLLEVASLVVLRTTKGIPFYKPSRDHFYMYLMANGWRKQHILWYVLCCSLFFLCVSYLFVFGVISTKQLFVLGALFLLFWISLLIQRQ